MGYLNDLINSGRLKSPSPLSAFQAPEPPASIAAPVSQPNPAWNGGTVPSVQQREPIPGGYYPGPGGTVSNVPRNAPSNAGIAATPPAPPKPQPIDYSQFTDGMADTDSPFVEQKALFNNALNKFLLEHGRQTGIVTADADTALGGVERNRVAGLTSLNEDLAARGLGRGGIMLDANKQASDQYGRQKIQVEQGRDRGLADLNSRKEKMQSDTAQNIQAARREAYNRLVAKQELI